MEPPGLKVADPFKFDCCEYCAYYAWLGFCERYRRPVYPKQTCDDFQNVLKMGKRLTGEAARKRGTERA